jgi:hypothetical protein
VIGRGAHATIDSCILQSDTGRGLVVTTESVCEVYNSSIVDCAGKHALLAFVILNDSFLTLLQRRGSIWVIGESMHDCSILFSALPRCNNGCFTGAPGDLAL